MFSPTRRAWLLVVSAALILSMSFLGCSLRQFGLPTPSDDKAFAVIEDTWEILRQQYFESGSVDWDALADETVQFWMDKLGDAHSSYLTPQQYDDYINDDKYIGIGVYITSVGGQLVITDVFPNSPAETGGVQKGDVILEVDGISTKGMTVAGLTEKVRGEIGTQLTLTVRHPTAAEPTLIHLTRAEVKRPSVSFEMYGDIAYISINGFRETTNDEMGVVLRQVASNGAKGIVVDLRDNPGGLVSSVVDVVSRFVKSGTVLTIQYNDGSQDVKKTTSQKETTDLPVVVLANGNSASASEVFCGALQDYGRAVIAGQLTYGKGSVNNLFPLSNGSAIYLTVARWLTPNGNLIEGYGITPDVDLRRNVDWIQWAVDYLNESK
jgi:carboxyl-terminal processing protease